MLKNRAKARKMDFRGIMGPVITQNKFYRIAD